MSVRSRIVAPLIALALALAAFAAVAAGATAAKPGEIVTFKGGCGSLKEASLPRRALLAGYCARVGRSTVGPAGEVWSESNANPYSHEPTAIVRTAADGSVERFAVTAVVPEAQPEVLGLAVGAEGALWAAVGEAGATVAGPYRRSIGGQLVRIDAAGSETSFVVPEAIEPRDITLGPDGNLWFTGVQGLWIAEHGQTLGTGYIGRITPAGEFTLFPTPVAESDPEAIAVAPDGTLWFTAAGAIDTIGSDGAFGRSYRYPVGVGGGIVIGPEGDAWLGGYGDIARLTPAGQVTKFPVPATFIEVGPEGNIWASGNGVIARVVPGAPGLAVWGIAADRRARRVDLTLACGGSTLPCAGTLRLALRTRRRRGPEKLPARTYAAAPVHYRVAAESQSRLSVEIPAKVFAAVSRYAAKYGTGGVRMEIEATVAGGPKMSRTRSARSLFEGP
jgi:streptogramin lyase